MKFRPKYVWTMSKLLSAIYDSNICTYYLLPLVRLNKFSFGADNFIQCYVSREGDRLYIELRDIPDFVYHRQDYLGITVLPSGGICVAFSLPDIWWEDYSKFQRGKYSKFSPQAKKCIESFSGMTINQISSGGDYAVTDSRILALDSSTRVRDALRKRLAAELDIDIPEDAELISVPSENNFLDNAIITNTLGTGSAIN